MLSNLLQSEALSSLGQLRNTLRQMRVRTRLFSVSVLLAVVATVINLYILQAVMAVSNGLIRNNFEFVRKYGFCETIISAHAGWFTSSASLFVLLLGVIYAASLLKNSISYTSSVTLSKMMALSSSQIRLLLFRRYLSFGKLYLDRVGTGRLHHILMKFSNEVSDQISALHRALKQLLLMATYVYLMVKISPLLTAILLGIAIVLNGGLHWLVTLSKQTSMRMALVQIELNQKVLNLLGCIPLIKSYAREKSEEARFAEINQREIAMSFHMAKEYHLQPCLEELLLMTVLVMIAAVIGYLARNSHSFRVGDTFMFIYLVKASIPTFGALRSYRLAMTRAAGPLSALNEMLEDGDKIFVPQGDKEFSGLKREIRIENLSFSFSPDTPVLRDVSCVIEKGKTTAIVGASGAGKSSLIHLLMRFYDCPPGTIIMDGEDIRNFTLPSIMSRVALVSQDIQLFNDTIRTNLLYGIDEPVTDEKILQKCNEAGISWLIRRLPQGLDTEIGDRGVRLSGGEKQRLALARAFLKDCEILILDEATSSIDSKAEASIHGAIEKNLRGRTLIFITHRLSTVKSADHLIVMEKGRVVETGAPPELIANRGHFYGYWDIQREGFQLGAVNV